MAIVTNGHEGRCPLSLTQVLTSAGAQIVSTARTVDLVREVSLITNACAVAHIGPGGCDPEWVQVNLHYFWHLDPVSLRRDYPETGEAPMQVLLTRSHCKPTDSAGARSTVLLARSAPSPLIKSLVRRVIIAFLLVLFSAVGLAHAQQSTLPFEVSNPKHKKWPEAQAARIYTWACDLLARSIRPEKPPQLHPKFVLVLGTDGDEYVRDTNTTEIHLKNWNPEKFAQGVVVVALRDLVHGQDLAKLAHQSVSLADSTIDAHEMSRP
jgi:hypothetical protein